MNVYKALTMFLVIALSIQGLLLYLSPIWTAPTKTGPLPMAKQMFRPQVLEESIEDVEDERTALAK